VGDVRRQLLGDQRKGRIGICGRQNSGGDGSGNGAAGCN
jgi:hypothetical protein